MVILKKLYLETETSTADEFVFEPINFKPGLNFILGESSNDDYNDKERNKMNGVGKSLLIEMIDYCLLADLKHSRLNLLPLDLIDDRTSFCLDLEAVQADEVFEITVKRNRMKSGSLVTIITNGAVVEHEDLATARKYLEGFFVMRLSPSAPSLRSLLSILIKTEHYVYDGLFYTDGDSKRYNYSELIKPHMYLFGIELELLDKVKNAKNELKNVKEILSSVRRDFKLLNVTEKDVKSHINDLQDKVESMNLSINNLEPSDAIEQRKTELASIQHELNELSTDKASKELMLEKIGSLPKVTSPNIEQIRFVYNSYKDGLGDMVAQSFETVYAFRKEVERYQQQLVVDKEKEVRKQIDTINDAARELRSRATAIYKILNAKEKIDDLMKAIELQQSSQRELTLMATKYELYQDKKNRKQEIERSLLGYFDALDAQIFELQNTVSSFESDLKDLHEAIAGNKKCQFELVVDKDSEKYIQANYRINLDGSAGIDRLATFMYDFLLMTNKHTSVRHPGLLIHDNIFPMTSRDDVVKALNYVASAETAYNFQYILTLNKDEIEARADELNFDYKTKTCKTLTRQSPLLGREYKEIR